MIPLLFFMKNMVDLIGEDDGWGYSCFCLSNHVWNEKQWNQEEIRIEERVEKPKPKPKIIDLKIQGFHTFQIFIIWSKTNVGKGSGRHEDAVRTSEILFFLAGQSCRERMWRKHARSSRQSALMFVSRFWAQSVLLLRTHRRNLLLPWTTVSIASALLGMIITK